MSDHLEHYPSVAKFLHWAIALMILFNLLSGLVLAYFFVWSDQFHLVDIHKQCGVMILFLVFLRIIWKLTHQYPTLDSLPIPAHEKRMAHIGHGLLYILMLLIPISGIFFSQSAGREVEILWLRLPQFIAMQERAVTLQILNVHKYLSIAIAVLAAIHLLAILKHHFISKHQILHRMLPRKKS